MNFDEAILIMEGLREQMLNEVPLSERTIRKTIVDWLERGKLHIKGIYQKGMKVGEGFSAIPQYCGDDSYLFFIYGIQRHLDVGKECVRQFNPDYCTKDPRLN